MKKRGTKLGNMKSLRYRRNLSESAGETSRKEETRAQPKQAQSPGTNKTFESCDQKAIIQGGKVSTAEALSRLLSPPNQYGSDDMKILAAEGVWIEAGEVG